MTDVTHSHFGLLVRNARSKKGISQRDLADKADISPTYLSLLESGKRPMSLPILHRLAGALGEDVERWLAAEGAPDVSLASLLDPQVARSLSIDTDSLSDVDPDSKLAKTVMTLFNLYKNARARLDTAIDRLHAVDGPISPSYAPGDEVTDFLQAHDNYFPALEAYAREVHEKAGLSKRFVSDQLADKMHELFGVEVRFATPSESSVVRSFDPERKIATVSTELSESASKFQLAHIAGLITLARHPMHEKLIKEFGPRHAETGRLIKIHLANYFAGALILPYDDVYETIMSSRYDVERVAKQFATSYEMVAHRICNLSKPGREGVPLHFMRVDVAGNISKRYSATGLQVALDQGSCPKKAVHMAFLTPGIIARQFSEMPDGRRYFCFARVQSEPRQGALVRGSTYSIGVGTRAEDAKHFVYADAVSDANPTPVGPSCRFCPRRDCSQRAAPSYQFPFAVNEYTKKDNFFSPQEDEAED